MLAFAEALPRIRRRCDRDLATRGLSREKVLASIVRLLELTLIRVGNDEYARLNRSFGLTTLRDRHATVQGGAVRFRFRGKSGQTHEVGLRDRRLAAIVRRCQDLPGQDLFQYVDDAGEARDVASEDVNAYIRDAAGAPFTAKDFRTWAGTVLAYRALRALQPGDGERGAKRNVVEAIRQTADQLGNTPAVARGSYVHPAVLEAYLAGSIRGALVQAAEEQATPPTSATPREEAAVRALLRQRLEDGAARSRAKRGKGKRGNGGRGGGGRGDGGRGRPARGGGRQAADS
jgi:DNA topoisomerase-1